MVEAFLIRKADDTLLGKSAFYVVISDVNDCHPRRVIRLSSGALGAVQQIDVAGALSASLRCSASITMTMCSWGCVQGFVQEKLHAFGIDAAGSNYRTRQYRRPPHHR